MVRRHDFEAHDPQGTLEHDFARFVHGRSVEAFDRVVLATRAWLLGVALRSLPRDLAEDAVQETYVTMLERGSTFEPERRLKPWMRAILASRIADIGRQRRLLPSSIDSHPDPATEDDGRPDEVEREELRRAIFAAGTQLPPKARLALWRRYVRGVEPSDMAIAQKEPSSTVRMRLARALAFLRTSITPGFGAGLAMWFGCRSARAASPAASRGTGPLLLGVWTVAAVLCLALGLVAWQILVPRPLEAPTEAAVAATRGIAPGTGRATDDATGTATSPSRTERTADAEVLARPPARIVWAADGIPLAHSEIGLEPLGVSLVLRSLEARTHEDGSLDLTGIPAGEYAVLVHYERIGSILVDDDGRAVPTGPAMLEVPSVGRQEFLVLGVDGQPVSGARLYVGGRDVPVARTDADGSCVCMHLHEGDRVFARTPDGTVTDELAVDDPLDGPLVLHVLTDTVRHFGRVVDSRGRVVAGAEVQVLFDRVNRDRHGEEWARMAAPRETVRTDRAGRFEFRVPRGTEALGLVVTSPHHVRWGFRTELVPDAPIELRVDVGARVIGRVLDDLGRPVSGAAVEIRGRDRRHTPAHRLFSRSDGSFALPACPVGTAELFVDGGESGRSTERLELAEGTVEHVVRLSRLPRVVGRVVAEEDGTPLAEVFVELMPIDRTGKRRTTVAQTDSGGRFALHPRWEDPSMLYVRHAKHGVPVGQVMPARPGAPIVARVPAPTESGPRPIFGRLSADIGDRLLFVRSTSNPDWRVWKPLGASDGSFRTDLPDGCYDLVLASRDAWSVADAKGSVQTMLLRSFCVGDGSVDDLGTIELPE
jgi:RNA polymerase sigma-70 factor (ECF subfamily)